MASALIIVRQECIHEGYYAAMKVILTGTVGLDKTAYLQKFAGIAARQGLEVLIYNVGERMYAEAPDIARGRILDVPLTRLGSLRRSVFKDLLQIMKDHEHIVVNTHATFRWRHGLFPAIDFDQIAQFDPDYFVCLMDNVEQVHARLEREHEIDHSLKDLLVWREEEIIATEMMTMATNAIRQAGGCDKNRPAARFYQLAQGKKQRTAQTLYQLLFEPEKRKVYLSFPITHVSDLPETLRDIYLFRQCVSSYFTVFDPGDLEEQDLYLAAVQASQSGQRTVEVEADHGKVSFEASEILQAAGDIHAQIYARDFSLIDQSDMIISLIPELANGKPAVSSGVERELQHAHEATREVYVIWQPRSAPSPFITETATAVFGSLEQALHYFEQAGYLNRQSDGRGQNTLFPVW